MTVRHLVLIAVALSLVSPLALAVESGKADGTMTINGKATKLKYAFAKKEKDPFEEGKERWTVVLTDRAVPRSLLNDDSRMRKAIEGGTLVAAVARFENDKSLQQVELKSNALKHGSLPINASQLKLTGPTFTSAAVEGAAVSTEEQEFFDDTGTMDVQFNAPLGIEKFGDNALAAKELAASGPKLKDGQAAGALKLDGSTIKLTHAIARLKPNSFDETKKDVAILLTDQPVAMETFVEDRSLFQAVEDGKVRGLLLKIDSDEKPYSLQLLDPKAPLQISGSGIFNFDSMDFSDKHVTGKFFTTEEEDFGGDHKYSYDVTFAVPVQNIVAPSEVTVDASTGKKLPAGGGDPGKAYLAFDKAARAGNLSEMKKYGSKSRPLPEMSPEEEKQMIELMKLLRPAKLKINDGYVSGDHATLIVEAEDPDDKAKMKGTIELALEDGKWKLLAERWKR
jgi:hypothetical protein